MKTAIKSSSALEYFEPRGSAGSRLEALSDGVFALAIAILLISGSVPGDYQELWLFVQDIIPFGVCILFIYWIWRQQCVFFLRYGFIDDKISFINLALLFFVLVYVYPLKFLMTWLIRYFYALISGSIIEVSEELIQMIPMQKMPHLMIIYGLGFICIWWCLYLMYKHVLKHSEELKLTRIELYETRFSMNDKRYLALIGGLSVVLSLLSILLKIPVGAALAGWVYNLIWIMVIIRIRKRKKELKLILEDQ